MRAGRYNLGGAIRLILILAMAIAINSQVISDACAQRGRGGGRGGGGMRGGGGARPSPSYNRSPSMSRPSSSSRATTRPSTGQARNAGGNRAAARPQGGTGRSAASGRNAAATNPRANPSRSELNSFLNLPSQGGNRAAGGAASRPAGANSAVSDFLNHNPTAQSTSSGRQAGSVANQRSENISNRTDARSSVRDSRGENRNFASDNRQDRVSDRGDRQAARVSTRGEMRSSLAAGRGENRSQRQERRSETANEIRNHLEEHYGHDHLFDDFWANNPQAHYRFHQNPVFWTWATVGTMRAFMPWNWGTGGGGETYYEDGTVYSGNEQIPAEEYAEQGEQILESAPEVENSDDMEWLPLGVFAITQDNNPDAIPNMFLQLAVSKEGIIAGTYQNKETDQTETIEGVVDQASKRAVWTIAGKNTPILETGVTNLTENETNVLVHFSDGSTQQWMMLHLENPDVSSQ